jgi:hypothetical protein
MHLDPVVAFVVDTFGTGNESEIKTLAQHYVKVVVDSRCELNLENDYREKDAFLAAAIALLMSSQELEVRLYEKFATTIQNVVLEHHQASQELRRRPNLCNAQIAHTNVK